MCAAQGGPFPPAGIRDAPRGAVSAFPNFSGEGSGTGWSGEKPGSGMQGTLAAWLEGGFGTEMQGGKEQCVFFFF